VGVEKRADGSERVVFTRPDPTEHALLVCKIGAHHGTVKESEHLKPPGTAWASEQDLLDAGFVPAKWQKVAEEVFKSAIRLLKSDPRPLDAVAQIRKIAVGALGTAEVDRIDAEAVAEEDAEARRRRRASISDPIGAATGSIVAVARIPPGSGS
jgi:hypothetical protein